MKIISVGKIKETYFVDILKDNIKKINQNKKIEIIELNDEKIRENSSLKEELNILKLEGENILKNIKKSDYVVSLAIEGKLINDEEFSGIINMNKDIVFVIGGSLGLFEEVKKRSNLLISFSRMTFTHNFMRVLLVDKILRSTL